MKSGWVGLATFGLTVVASSLGVAAPAYATPGNGAGLGVEPYLCPAISSQPVDVSVPADQSPAGFADGAVFIATRITVTDDSGKVVFSKTYGHRNGAGAPVECFGQLNGDNVDAWVAPVGQAAK
jgi:hypothetical protein